MQATASQPAVATQPLPARPRVPGFEELYDHYFDFVWRSVRRLGVPEAQVDDAVQDVFLVVHRKLGSFEARSSAKTWLFGIAMRVASDYRRASRRRGLHVELPETLPCPRTDSPLEATERAEASRFLHAFLDTLDEDKRVAFVLAELEQMSAPEIARTLRVNLNTIYSRIRAARQGFAGAVERARKRGGVA